jgi:hypothetical protein
MAIQFTTPIELVIQKEEKKTISSLTIISVIDQPINKTVVVSTKEIGKFIIWQGAAYDAIGQWTDTDVQNRILEIYS